MTLLEECIEALGDKINVIEDESKKELVDRFERSFPISETARISWDHISQKSTINTVEDIRRFVYPNNIDDVNILIIWDDDSLPIIKTTLSNMISVVDDVLAVSFDTWVIFEDFETLIEFYHEGSITIGKV